VPERGAADGRVGRDWAGRLSAPIPKCARNSCVHWTLADDCVQPGDRPTGRAASEFNYVTTKR